MTTKERKINSLNLQKRTVSKTMFIFFILIHIVFGLDFGFIRFKSSKAKLLLKILTLSLSAFIASSCFISFYSSDMRATIACSMHLLRYFINVLSLLCFNDSTVFDLQETLNIINSKYGGDKCFKLDIKVILCFILIFVFNTVPSIIMNTQNDPYCVNPKLLTTLIILPITAIDFVLIVYSFLFYSVLCHLGVFVRHLATSDVVVSQAVYKEFVDITENTKKVFDCAFVLALLITIPYLLLTIYDAMAEVSVAKCSDIKFKVLYIVTLKFAILTIAPVIASEKLTFQAEDIKKILHDRLLKERDECSTKCIKRFIDYVDARPIALRGLMIVPMNSSLIVIILQLCTNYAIITIQLSHLY